MSNLILTDKDMFRAERLFSERISSPINCRSITHIEGDFNKSISRLVVEAKKYRVVHL
jgi:hypothetical protein